MMSMHTRISEKGQVVVPKAMRDRLGWSPGTDLEVRETDGVVSLQRPSVGKTLTAEEAVQEFRRIYRHEGPPATLEQMRQDVAEEVARRWPSG